MSLLLFNVIEWLRSSVTPDTPANDPNLYVSEWGTGLTLYSLQGVDR